MKKILIALLANICVLSASPLHIDGVKAMLDEAQKVVKEVTPKELKKMLDAEENFYIIDLRGSDQVERGEIYSVDSFKIPRGYLEFRVELKIPDKNAKIVLYCCSGKRSILAAKSLMDMGYTNVAHLHGGIREWVEQDLPLDTTYGEMHKLETEDE